jgi:hypothetical protein
MKSLQAAGSDHRCTCRRETGCSISINEHGKRLWNHQRMIEAYQTIIRITIGSTILSFAPGARHCRHSFGNPQASQLRQN